MKLTDSELQIMELFWNQGKALSSSDILDLSPDNKSWKDSSVFIMIQTLQKKKAVREIGAVKGEKGKYLRLLEPTFSREEYYSAQINDGVSQAELPMLFSALLDKAELSDETISELEKILKNKRSKKNK